MDKGGIPLPSNLSGNELTRLIHVDEALLFLVVGAMVEMLDYWKLEQTGALTPEQAKEALTGVLYDLIQI